MSKIRRRNYVFLSWIGDHGHHVHVYRDRKLVVKWDLDRWQPMKGRATSKLQEILRELLREGKL